MAKLIDYFNPSISQKTGFISAIQDIHPFGSKWYGELGDGGVEALDSLIRLKLGEREVFKPIGDPNVIATYNRMSHILMSYNYQLDGLYELLIPNDGSEGGYNPLDNVNEVRHEETDTDFDKGAESSSLNGGARKYVTKNPERTDIITNTGSTTAFDDTDYDEATDKNVSTNKYDDYDVESNQDEFTDTTSNSARHDDTKMIYDVTRHGNIGVTTSFDLIAGDRKLHYFNFFNEVINVIIKEMLSSMLWEV